MKPIPLNLIAEEVAKFDIIFNTIPALVIDAEVLYRIKKEYFILDIATSPGG